MRALILTTLFLVGFGPFMCEDPDVEQARQQLVANEPASALETLAELTDDAAEVHLARALAHMLSGDDEAATSALDQAYRLIAGGEARGAPLADGKALRARVAFARGLIAAGKEQWEDAQVEFGTALRHAPDDEDARWNLELAWYKANPPCPLREDDHEPDNTRKDAKPFDPEKAADRLLCPTNEDWYTLPVQRDAMLYVRLKGEVVAQEDDETREVTLALFAPKSADDAPVREAKVTTEGAASTGYSWVRDAGDWHIRVAGPGRAEFKYGLEVEIVPPCPADDQLEENDTRDAAKAVPQDQQGQQGAKGLKACPGDPDWYQFDVPSTEGRRVTIAFDPQRAPLRAALYEVGAEVPVAVGQSGKGGLSIAIPKQVDPDTLPDAGTPPPPKRYVLEVSTTTGSENNYALQIQPDDGDGDKNQDQQDQNKDQQDKGKQDKQDKDKQDKQKDQGGQQPKPEPKKPEKKPADQVDMDKLIDALDQHKRNPQLEKALRALPVVPRMEDY